MKPNKHVVLLNILPVDNNTDDGKKKSKTDWKYYETVSEL